MERPTGKKVFITGIAGFIGYHLALFLKKRGDSVIGIDNFNSYYDPFLKKERAQNLKQQGIEVLQGTILDTAYLNKLLIQYKISHCVHLAAQAGVRHSFSHPKDYIDTNIVGFASILEALKDKNIHLVYASSSSVYGNSRKVPFKETNLTDEPANLYGATKKSNEVMAASYHELYGLKVTGLRYFTVYGPWGRPDMAYYIFAEKMRKNEPIDLFMEGKMKRDFTYIDDIVTGTAKAIDYEASHEIFNLGNHTSIEVIHLVRLLEKYLKTKAIVRMHPTAFGESFETYADINKAHTLLGFSPETSLEKGLKEFTDWYLEQTSSSLKQACR